MKIKFRTLLIIWIVVMFTVSSIPDLKIIPHWHFTWKDKIAHIAEYAILALLFLLMLRQENRIANRKRRLLTILCFGLLISVIDELHQLFIPGRSTDFLDIVADFFGIVIMAFIFDKIQNHRFRLELERNR